MTNHFETRIIIYAIILAVMFIMAICLTVISGSGRKRRIGGFCKTSLNHPKA